MSTNMASQGTTSESQEEADRARALAGGTGDTGDPRRSGDYHEVQEPGDYRPEPGLPQVSGIYWTDQTDPLFRLRQVNIGEHILVSLEHDGRT